MLTPRNEMLTTLGSSLIHPKHRYWSKIAIFAPVKGLRRNIAIKFGMGKLEWCGYPTMKNFEDMVTGFDAIHERDGQTDRHRMTA